MLRPGGTIVVWRLDRLGRSLSQLIRLVNRFQERDVGFASLVEAIDTTTPAGKFFFQITGAFAELERHLIRERTKAGLEAARVRGRMVGRPKAIKPEVFAMAKRLCDTKEVLVGEICTRLGIAKRTFYRYLKAEQTAESGDK